LHDQPPLEFETVFGTFFDGGLVVRQIQRAFLAAAAENGGEHGERDKGKQQTLHGGAILEKSNGRSIPSTRRIAYRAAMAAAPARLGRGGPAKLAPSMRPPVARHLEDPRMSLSEARYHDLVDAAQEGVEDAFDDSALDVDLENSGGVLTVRFANGSQLIHSRQPALRQLWVAARSGGFPFDYDEDAELWICDNSEERLGELLARVTQEQGGEALAFEDL